MADDFIVPPPNPLADFERRPVLFAADGKALVRAAGFVPQGARMAVQTSGVAPKLNTKPKAKAGKKGGGKRGC